MTLQSQFLAGGHKLLLNACTAFTTGVKCSHTAATLNLNAKTKVFTMVKRKTVLGLTLALGALGTLGACEQHPQERSGRGVGLLRMPNPASLYCVKKGGELKMETTDKGQVGYCHLPDGTVVEEWKLFRQDNPRQEG